MSEAEEIEALAAIVQRNQVWSRMAAKWGVEPNEPTMGAEASR